MVLDPLHLFSLHCKIGLTPIFDPIFRSTLQSIIYVFPDVKQARQPRDWS